MSGPIRANRFPRLLCLILAIPGLLLPVAAGALDHVVTNCTNEDDLRFRFNAVQAAGGGTLTFDCGEATIPIKIPPLTVTAPTTVNGGNEITLSGQGDRRVFEIAAGVTVTLESLVLVDGKAPIGGAILNNGNLTLREVRVLGNEASQDGGAIASYGRLTITDGSLLSNNVAASGGGAIFVEAGELTTIEDSEISFNTSNGAFAGTGGAIELLLGSDLVISNGTLTNNSAERGGAISALSAGSTVSIDESALSDNDTIDGAGGGILVEGGSLAIVDSTFARNDAINGSGGGVFLSGTGSVRRSTFDGNSSTTTGGGIAIDSSNGVLIENVTFNQNGAILGGALSSSESTATVDHATFAHNVAIAGSSFSNGAGGGTLTLRNTILTNPVTSGNCSDDQTETTASLGGNLSSDASCVGLLDQASDQHETDPKLSETLADNGGPTQTYLPQPGSPVIDAGVLSQVPVDQRGFARPQGEAYDIGAVEVFPCAEAVCGDADDNGSVSASDSLAALRTAVGTGSCPLFRCDYDDSGEVQASDALAILRASVGLPTDPSCPASSDCPPA